MNHLKIDVVSQIKLDYIYNMTYTEITKKLVGDISPIGESNTDEVRFENLKEMCTLVNDLIAEIDNVAFYNKNSHESSVKRAGEYASIFLTKTIGIVE